MGDRGRGTEGSPRNPPLPEAHLLLPVSVPFSPHAHTHPAHPHVHTLTLGTPHTHTYYTHIHTDYTPSHTQTPHSSRAHVLNYPVSIRNGTFSMLETGLVRATRPGSGRRPCPLPAAHGRDVAGVATAPPQALPPPGPAPLGPGPRLFWGDAGARPPSTPGTGIR